MELYIKAGAIGIAFWALMQAASLLKAEMSREIIRPQGRTMIIAYMAFAVLAFIGAGFLEIRSKSFDRDDILTKSHETATIINGLLTGKRTNYLKEIVDRETKTALISLDIQICNQLGHQLVLTGDSNTPSCKKELSDAQAALGVSP